MARNLPRTGSEPDTARSALGLRLVLAVFGLLCGIAGTVVFGLTGLHVGAVAFAVLGVVAALDVALVGRRMRQGAHFQPGADVPPYEPVRPPRARRAGVSVPAATRTRRYLILMGVCLTLITVAWVWVRTFSTTGAVVMSVIAMFIPPIASFVANVGALPPEGRPEHPPDDHPDQPRSR